MHCDCALGHDQILCPIIATVTQSGNCELSQLSYDVSRNSLASLVELDPLYVLES